MDHEWGAYFGCCGDSADGNGRDQGRSAGYKDGFAVCRDIGFGRTFAVAESFTIAESVAIAESPTIAVAVSKPDGKRTGIC